MRPVEAIVGFSVRRPWLVLAVALILSVLGAYMSVAHFAINSDTARLVSDKVGWRKTEIEFDRTFPQRTELIVAVIDALTPEQAGEAATRLTADLAGRQDLILSVEQPEGGEFLAREGLLLLDTKDLQAKLGQIDQKQELLAIFAADPSLRGFGRLVRAGLRGIQGGDVALADLAPFFDRFSATFEQVLDGKPGRLSWQGLMSVEPQSARQLVLIKPHLDYGALQPGAVATEMIRARIEALGLTPANGITVRFTGQVPLADEEFVTVLENMNLNIGLTILAIIVILYLALRSPKLIVAVLVTLVVGLVVTCGLALLVVGQFNLISVAFFALFIGLGVDFGIQFAVRYRADRHDEPDLGRALIRASRGVGFSLTLAALSLIAGFLSFLPTSFVGVSELGEIAGMGMGVAYLASFTVLPAMITLLKPPRESRAVETASLAGVDEWIGRHRVLVLGITAAVILAGMPALLKLRFNSNPMDLKSRSVESVATYLDLTQDPNTNPNTVDVIVPTVGDVPAVSQKLAALPEVGHTVSLLTFLPTDQDAKLALIRKAAEDLEPILTRKPLKAPTDVEQVAALREARAALDPVARSDSSAGAKAAGRLATDLGRLADATAAVRVAADTAVTVDFKLLIQGLGAALSAQPVSRETLPKDIVEQWVAPDGRARVTIFPKGDVNDNAASERFVSEVRRVAPAATGAPVTIAQSGKTIVQAFMEAGIFSLIAITLILWIAMRRLLDVVLALGPLVLAGIMTLEFAHLVGMELNYANIISLPLMFGVGVAFHIYYLIAWRAGVVDVLASSLTRAIFFSALTTGTAFGSLWASSHPGTSSMGELLAISLVFTLVAAFVIVPAFLGPPKEEATARPVRT